MSLVAPVVEVLRWKGTERETAPATSRMDRTCRDPPRSAARHQVPARPTRRSRPRTPDPGRLSRLSLGRSDRSLTAHARRIAHPAAHVTTASGNVTIAALHRQNRTRDRRAPHGPCARRDRRDRHARSARRPRAVRRWREIAAPCARRVWQTCPTIWTVNETAPRIHRRAGPFRCGEAASVRYCAVTSAVATSPTILSDLAEILSIVSCRLWW